MAAACGNPLDPAATGSGTVVESQREVGSFDAIEVDGPLAVTVTAGDTPAVVVRTDDNLQQRVTATVDGGTLQLGLSDQVRTDTLEVAVTVPTDELTSIAVGGAGTLTDTEPLVAPAVDVRAGGASRVFVVVDTDAVGVEADGASIVNVTGQAITLRASADGASAVEAGDLPVQDATVDVRGASRATVDVSGTLDARAAGASTIEYSGDPEVSSEADASSTVRTR